MYIYIYIYIYIIQSVNNALYRNMQCAISSPKAIAIQQLRHGIGNAVRRTVAVGVGVQQSSKGFTVVFSLVLV
jgi:hypothetical protein